MTAPPPPDPETHVRESRVEKARIARMKRRAKAERHRKEVEARMLAWAEERVEAQRKAELERLREIERASRQPAPVPPPTWKPITGSTIDDLLAGLD